MPLPTLPTIAAEDTLGFFVWWGPRLVRITPAELHRIFVDVGLSPAHMPKDPTEETGFCRAVQAIHSKREGLTYRLLRRTPIEIAYGLCRWNESETEAAASQFAKVSYLRANRQVISDRPDDEVVRRIIGEIPTYRDNFITSDIQGMLVAAMGRLNGVTIAGTSGNSRWVPAGAGDSLAKLKAAMSQITDREGRRGTQGFTMAPVPRDESWRSLGETSARSEFGGRVAAAEADLAGLKARIEAHAEAVAEAERAGVDVPRGGVRGSTIAARMSEYRGLRDTIESYAEALSFRADSMLENLDSVREELTDMLGG